MRSAADGEPVGRNPEEFEVLPEVDALRKIAIILLEIDGSRSVRHR
jgi:hypothetical protein